MSGPLPGDVHVNAPLTNISIAYMQSADSFVADKVFPNIPVAKQSDRYYTYDRGEFNRDEMQERAPGTESAGGSYTLDNTPTYFARVYSFHKDIDDQMRANADDMLNPDREATMYVTSKALIRREKLFVQRFMKPGLWLYDAKGTADGTSATGISTRRWDDAASNPVTTMKTAKRTVAENTGYEPNTLVLSRSAYDALIEHPDIIDRVNRGQTTGAAQVTRQNLAALFEVERVLVMNAIENVAKEGQAAQHRFIGSNNALLCYATKAPGLMTPTAGYTFSWTGLMGSGAMGGRIRSFRMEHLGSDRVEIDMSFDQKIIGADLGFYFDDIVSNTTNDANVTDASSANVLI